MGAVRVAGGRIDILVAPDFDGFDGKLRSGLNRSTGLASTLGKGIGLAIAAGAAVAAVGLKSVIELGNEYVGNLNELQAVTHASGIEMAKVGDLAKKLGADMTLPATSAADAAAAMKELAKGGLSVNDAMTAAKGTLQLAAAAQIDAARAAEIQSDALNQFGLAADQAGHVADVLANTANAASGEITDMASALKFVGPVARAIGVDIDSTAAAIGVLAVNGIRGEQAGTSLRGVIASLASPSAPAATALKTLGVVAFDATGKFVGLRDLTDQLAKAKGRLSDAAFAAAASTAFGNEGLTTANALALSGAAAFDEMATAVSRSGGAADVAAAKTKGLKGAWEGLKSQLETSAIGIFEAIDGPLEGLVRGAATQIDRVGQAVVVGLNEAIAIGEVYGPRLAAAISSRGQVVGQAIREVIEPIAKSSIGVLNETANRGIELWDNFTGVLKNAVDGARPLAQGIAAVVTASTQAGAPVATLGAALGVVGGAARIASGLLVPLGKLVGGIASAFAELPGPIQTAIVALGLVAAFKGPLGGIGDTIKDKLTTPFARFGETIRLQQALLTGSTDIMSSQVGKVGLAMAALGARVPALGKMADSFRNASTAAQGFVVNQSALLQTASGISGQYTTLATALAKAEGALRGIAGAAAGTTAALGTGLRAAAGGLVNLFGGPWGIALAAAGVALSLISAEQEAAAEAARKQTASVKNLASAFRESNGAINEAIRTTRAKELQDDYKEATKSAEKFGISLGQLTSASLRQGDSFDILKTKLQDIVKANTTYSKITGGAAGDVQVERLNETGAAAAALLADLKKLAGGSDDAREAAKKLAQAIKDGRASMLDGTESGRTMAAAMDVLKSSTAGADEKARALKDAIDSLSGGSISLEAAQSKVNATMDRLSEMFKTNGSEAEIAARAAKGWGQALLNANGSINTTLPNGRALFDTLQDLSTESINVAAKTFEVARASGDSIPVAMGKAEASVKATRDALIAQADKWGLTGDQVSAVLDKYGLVPSQIITLMKLVDADKTQLELFLIKLAVDKVPPGKSITMQTISEEAEKKLAELGFKVTHMQDGTVRIDANDQPARDKLNNLLATPATKFVNIVFTGGESLNIGGRAVNHDGNLVKAQAFAHGGIKPFKAGVAQMFPPRMLRITGDRFVDDEAYIPVNRSLRSQALLQETASRMGYDLIRRFAVGGFAASGPTSAPSVPLSLDGMAITGRLRLEEDGFASLVDARIQHGMNQAGSAFSRRRRV